VLWTAAALAAISIVGTIALYISFAGLIDERLHGERERTFPRVYARPVEIHKGQLLSAADVISRLNDLGYAQRPTTSKPGEFATVRNSVVLVPRGGEFAGKTIEVAFPAPPKGNAPPRPGVVAVSVDGKRVDSVQL